VETKNQTSSTNVLKFFPPPSLFRYQPIH